MFKESLKFSKPSKVDCSSYDNILPTEKDFPKYLPQMHALYKDLFGKGKLLRAKLTIEIGQHLQLPLTTQRLLAKTIEFIHNASLLHDDFIDRTPLRRQKEAAWLRYSPEHAILAGDYLLTKVMMHLSHFGNLKLIQYTSDVLLNLLEGEWLQDTLTHKVHSDLKKMDRIYHWKTSSLFCWCLRAPWLVALGEGNGKEEGKGEGEEELKEKKELHTCLNEMGHLLGLLFQRGDDLLDFNVRNYEKKKILCDLEASYLNSVLVFLLKTMPHLKEKNFFQVKSMEELHCLVGKEQWQNRIKAFDAINEELIASYHKHLDRLLSLPLFIQKIQNKQGFKEMLSLLPHLLYLRKLPKDSHIQSTSASTSTSTSTSASTSASQTTP